MCPDPMIPIFMDHSCLRRRPAVSSGRTISRYPDRRGSIGDRGVPRVTSAPRPVPRPDGTRVAGRHAAIRPNASWTVLFAAGRGIGALGSPSLRQLAPSLVPFAAGRGIGALGERWGCGDRCRGRCCLRQVVVSVRCEAPGCGDRCRSWFCLRQNVVSVRWEARAAAIGVVPFGVSGWGMRSGPPRWGWP